jgi:hypothetical protein
MSLSDENFDHKEFERMRKEFYEKWRVHQIELQKTMDSLPKGVIEAFENY